MPTALGGRIASMRTRIDDAARHAGRDPATIVLVGVTKRQPRESVVAAIEEGLTDVAETYVQEARDKFADLPPARKHFIGRVQTNKAKAIVETFDVVQTIDRYDAGAAIATAAQRLGRSIRTLVQIDLSGGRRFGADPAGAPLLAERLRAEQGLLVDGVMAIGPHTDDRTAIARAFALAAKTWRAVGGTTLSIGMSGDWHEAIGCGTTMLRIGTAIFGARP